MSFIAEFFIFILGLLIGSFLNVVIFRTEKEEEIVRTPSHCPYCKTKLKWFELFPLLSYSFQGGKCRYCREKISPQYFLVEFCTATGFVFIYNQFLKTANISSFYFLAVVSFWFILYSFFVLIFAYDFRHKIIPDNFLYPALFVAFFYNLYRDIHNGCLGGINSSIVSGLFAAAAISFFFWCLFYFSKGRWMGFGDVKLVMLLGFLLGPSATAVAVFIAFFLGSVVGIFLVLFSKLKMKSQIPFGPFLILGCFFSFFYYSEIVIQYYRMANGFNIFWTHKIAEFLLKFISI